MGVQATEGIRGLVRRCGQHVLNRYFDAVEFAHPVRMGGLTLRIHAIERVLESPARSRVNLECVA